MLSFTREGSKIRIKVDTSIGWNYTETIVCSDEPYAILLRDNLANHMFRELQRVREEAYKQGWDDKQKRKPKRTWWPGTWR